MEIKTKKEFDAIKFARKQKDKLSSQLSQLTKQEIVEYFQKVRMESQIKPSA